MNTSRLKPTLRSLRRHRLPTWYDDAKLGIFIHWSVSSVIGWAPRDRDINEILRQDYDNAQAFMPYTEWYENSLRLPDSPVSDYHRRTYGSRTYASFAADYQAALQRWEPTEWARQFRQAGARYVVLVTKHHDGFCLWPSDVRNPHRNDWHTRRDCVSELAAAVRAEGMRFGVYYSGGLDWTFEPMPLRTMGDVAASVPRGDYPAYAEAQVRELIQRVEPDVLWNDIAWPTPARKLYQLFADYYAAVPDGVVNDRWLPMSPIMASLRNPLVRRAFDALMRRSFRKPDAALKPPGIGFFDYQTPEYTVFPDVQRRKWECVRGIDKSFGYNRNSQPEDFITRDDLIRSLCDIVSKNGNLLLNVGPRGEDAMIPDLQLDRLRWLGEWLATNGEAIHDTRPWTHPEGKTADGTPLRFTARGRTVYAILLGTPAVEVVKFPDLRVRPTTTARLLGGETIACDPTAVQVQVRLGNLRDSPAHVVAFNDVSAAAN
ncbi:MAG TPA: alpha-L-fucosidase [Candidatus Acidoferrales bacterium]|nr:alpha-L-fucosidase [Candidatus Acidoferrales bacterium]